MPALHFSNTKIQASESSKANNTRDPQAAKCIIGIIKIKGHH
jgi:hypothetical protein